MAVSFTADLFYNIVMMSGTKAEDLVFFWTTCRSVCRDFKSAVERAFAARHLSKTDLHLDPGMRRDKHGTKVMLASEFTFSHLDPNDRTRAIFRETECHEEIKPILVKALKSLMQYGNPVHTPKIIISIRHEANDTFIPDLELNFDELEIKCNWIGMFSEWFREEREYRKRLSEALRSVDTAKKMEGVREKLASGEMSELDSLDTIFDTFFRNYEDSRKTLRDERIKRNVHKEWKEKGLRDEMEWSGTGNGGYQRLKELRSSLGWDDPFSDEEDEEEERRGDEDVDEDEDSDGSGGSEDEDEDDEEEEDDDGGEEEEADGEEKDGGSGPI